MQTKLKNMIHNIKKKRHNILFFKKLAIKNVAHRPKENILN